MALQQFPRSSTGVVSVPAVTRDGITLWSYHVAATSMSVRYVAPDAVDPHRSFQPITAVRVDPYVIGYTSQNKSPVEVNGTLNRAGFWLTTIRGPQATVPSVEYEVRAVVGLCTPEVVASGQLKLSDWSQSGLIVQVSGMLATQYELWARLAQDDDDVVLSIDTIVDRFHGQRFEVIKGAIST